MIVGGFTRRRQATLSAKAVGKSIDAPRRYEMLEETKTKNDASLSYDSHGNLPSHAVYYPEGNGEQLNKRFLRPQPLAFQKVIPAASANVTHVVCLYLREDLKEWILSFRGRIIQF